MQSGPGAAGLFTCCPGNGNLMARQLLTAAAVGSGLFRYLELGLPWFGLHWGESTGGRRCRCLSASAQHEYDLL